MRINKAYVTANETGRQSLLGNPERASEEKESKRGKAKLMAAGDSINISEEAREMLTHGERNISSGGHADATYDQYGNVTRQFESVRNDLRKLAAQFSSNPEGAAIGGRLTMMSGQLASLNATV